MVGPVRERQPVKEVVMRLWIDGQCLQSVSRMRGIGRYVSEFISALSSFQAGIELEISFNAAMPDEAVLARDLVRPWIPPRRVHVWQGMSLDGEATAGYTDMRRACEIALAHHVACLEPDVALSASPFEGLHDACVPFQPPVARDFGTAALFFDAIPYRFRQRYLASNHAWVAYERRLKALNAFDQLLAISEFSQFEALTLHPGARVVPIDAGVSPEFMALAAQDADPLLASRLGLEPQFMLYVGGLDWRKNVGAVIDAYVRLPSTTRNRLQFVVVGDYPLSAEIATVGQWLGLGLPKQNLRMLGHVSDSTLVQLYKLAVVAIQPSLMEGFGLTALEAMACGTPVIAANAGALPEVISHAEALFDPLDPADIANHIHRTFTDAAFAAELTERSRERAKHYSWERSTTLAAHALESIVRPSSSARPRDRATLRQATFEEAKRARLSPRMAIFLAAAEADPPGPERLLIDVTSTCRIDHATGIQRVVNRITAELVAARARDDAVRLTYCDASDAVHEAALIDGRLSFAGRSDAPKIRFNASDRLLMLDSSWEFYEAHDHVLQMARLQGCEVVSTLYDLVPVMLPAFCDDGMPPVFVRWLKVALLHSTAFICISRAVADQLVALLQTIEFPRPLKVGYWPLGADFRVAPTQRMSAPNETWARSPMFLMVGTLEPRKAHRVALEGFTQLWKEGFDGSLVIAGKRGWGVDTLVEEILRHELFGKRLTWVEGPDDARLQELYHACDALIATSYAEGFGLPLVEAAFHGKPIIASDLPVFREVAAFAGRAMFFETGSSSALVSAVRTFVETPPATVDDPTAHTWTTWAESARQLESVIRDDAWYRVYRPAHSLQSNSASGIGRLSMARALGADEQRFELTLVDGPSASDDDRYRNITIKFTNLSTIPWSSEGTEDGRFGIQLGGRVFTEDGLVVKDENLRARIPLILAPGDSAYLRLSLFASYWKLKGHFVHVQPVQEGITWWDEAMIFPT